jgi:hypothetical protein
VSGRGLANLFIMNSSHPRTQYDDQTRISPLEKRFEISTPNFALTNPFGGQRMTDSKTSTNEQSHNSPKSPQAVPESPEEPRPPLPPSSPPKDDEENFDEQFDKKKRSTSSYKKTVGGALQLKGGVRLKGIDKVLLLFSLFFLPLIFPQTKKRKKKKKKEAAAAEVQESASDRLLARMKTKRDKFCW